MNSNNEQPVPSPALNALIGGGDFKTIGTEFFNHMKNLGRLMPNQRVLDVGCGVGRMAIPLTNYLEPGGKYEGFDAFKEGIDWCNQNISQKHPNFHFQWINIFNDMYNPGGKIKANELSFPFENNSFDFAFLTSVFTHMVRKDMEHYLAELHRVLSKGGRCLITFFVLNRESLGLIQEGKSTIDFKYGKGICLYKDKKMPEDAIAYEEQYIRNLYSKRGFKIVEPLHYGSWCGRGSFLSYQDIVVAEKI